MTATLVSFLIFALAASATPGPNNIMVLATAATRGFKTTIPIILGVALGFGFMVAAVGVGLAAPLARYPLLHILMRWGGVAWMLVLAWHIARAPAVTLSDDQPKPAPLGFWGACAFQWINPKAWIMAVATAATYTLPGVDRFVQSLLLGALFVLVSLPTVGGWALLGVGTARFLATPKRMRRFNLVMGLLLAVSVLPALFE